MHWDGASSDEVDLVGLDDERRRPVDEFAGKVAIVTGAGSGIGEACATLLARRGAKVLVADVRAEAGRGGRRGRR